MKFLGLLIVQKRRLLAGLFVAVFVLETVAFIFEIPGLISPNLAEAAPVMLANNANTTGTTHTIAGSALVFINGLVGYKFYRHGAAPHNGMCVYRKTTDGGATWATQIPVDSQTDCAKISVWYDRWTPGDAGDFIHISTIDTGVSEIFYNRLNTINDALLLATATTTNPASAATYAAGTNVQSISKSTTGRLYMVADDQQGTQIVSCNSNCNITTNWSLVGTAPQGNADSWSMLMPLASGNVMLINRSTGNLVRSSIWNGTIWSAFTTIAASAVRNVTYDVGMAATLDTDTNDLYLAYIADNDSFTVADHDIRLAVYSSSSWATRPNLITNDPVRGLLQIAISRDQNTGHIYTAFTARSAIATTNSVNAYYYRSINGMTSWQAEQGPVNTTAGNYFGIEMNIMSFDRIYTTWFDSVVSTIGIYGATIADIGPVVTLSTLGNQVSQVRNSINNFYTGGTFALGSIATRTVSRVVVNETGTVNAANELANVKLFYDFDNSAPQNCASESYSGSETQFGTTSVAGFSGANGSSTFNNAPITVGPGQSICYYIVMDVLPTAVDGNTIEIQVTNPRNDITVSGGIEVFPFSPVLLAGTTTVVRSDLRQTGYHWRRDDGDQASASSATADNENTPRIDVPQAEVQRLRLAVANIGSTSTLPASFSLEYATAAPTCADAVSWIGIGSSNAHFNMSPTVNLNNGSNTTNITVGTGGVTDPDTTFLTPNGAVLDQATSTGSLILPVDNFLELEFSLQASTSAVQGDNYCFRVVGNGQALQDYQQYASLTLATQVTASVFGNQIATISIPSTNVYAGGGLLIRQLGSDRSVTAVTMAELGTVNAGLGISNVSLYYDLDTSAPYNCLSESYNGTESQYGTTSISGFDVSTETKTFNDSVIINNLQSLCIYIVYDTTGQAANGQTVAFGIVSPATDIIVTGFGSVGPASQIQFPTVTQLQGGILTQTSFHWRNNDGNEVAATSATLGSQNTPLIDFSTNKPIRLRFGLSNEGLAPNVPTRFRLEYAQKITLCSAAAVWTDVSEANDGWSMFDSTFLTNGQNTTNITVGSGGVTDGNLTFLSNNGGVRDTESRSSTTTLSSTEFTELEFSITSTGFTAYNTTYCFRVSALGTPLPAYDYYAEITTASKRDFKIQRGMVQITGTSSTLVAGVDYDAPSSTSSAFVIITNSNQTGAGHNTGSALAQNVKDVTAYILNPQNLLTSFTIARPPVTLINNTRVYYEITEFISAAATDNEMIVRDVRTISLNAVNLIATGTPVTTVSDNSKVVVYITGSSNRNTSRNYFASQITAQWDPITKSPVFRREANGAAIADFSYAVVEYTGVNWRVQRVEHSYVAANVIETESISPVNSLSRTFIHAQKRMGALNQVMNYGHEVWLSSIGDVSFRLAAGASISQQVSAVWIIENLQSGQGAMQVQRSNGTNAQNPGGPLTISVILGTPVSATNNTSINGNATAIGNTTTFPRPMMGLTLTSSSTYDIWRSNTGSALTYRVEVIEWPVADLALRQNYYRFYAHNNALIPTDAWPPGPANLGENTSITINDEPLSAGERLRVRMSLQTSNATLPADFYNFKLQYGLRVSTCSALSPGNWFDVGGLASSTIWRGFSATATINGIDLASNPAQGGELLLSVSDVGGSLVHTNPSPTNPHAVLEGDNLEYDWHLEHNGALPSQTYCFRITRADSTPLNTYTFYPQIRTANFTPVSQNWRWFSDVQNETPSSPLAAENSAPIDIMNNAEISLRVGVAERKNVTGENIKFKVQFSEDSNFSVVRDVVASSSCQDLSLWCYSDGVVADNQLISTQLLSGGSGCSNSLGNGCGRHNTAPGYSAGHFHLASRTQEYSFNLKHKAARANTVYYFRLYDVTNNEVVVASSSYPSLVTEGPSLNLSVSGLPAGTTTAGLITDVNTSPQGINFGALGLNNDVVAAHRLVLETNASEGYQVLKFAVQPLSSSNGSFIESILGTNQSPLPWLTACLFSANSCVGYHTTDAILFGGSTRFAPTDTYAALSTAPVEVMYSSIPARDTHDIVYRILVRELQPAGDYVADIVYLAVPSY